MSVQFSAALLPPGVYNYDNADRAARSRAGSLGNQLEQEGVPMSRSGHHTTDKQLGYIAVGQRNVKRMKDLGDLNYHTGILKTGLTEHRSSDFGHPFNRFQYLANAEKDYRLPRDVRGALRSFQASWQRMLKQLEVLNRTTYKAIDSYIRAGQPLPVVGE